MKSTCFGGIDKGSEMAFYIGNGHMGLLPYGRELIHNK